MAHRLQEYYTKYYTRDEWIELVANWLKFECYPTTVQVGGKSYEMTLTRWIKRLEKSTKSKINTARREKRRESLRANEGKFYYTQPAMKTVPLHQDLSFLKSLLGYVNSEEQWKSNKDDTQRTLVPESRAWYKSELQNLVTMETIRNPV